MIEFGHVVTAMVTPFDEDDRVDFDEAIRLAHHLVDNGTDTILVAGTTGESPTLTHDEEFELFKVLVEEFKGRIPIMAGTGSNCTRTAVKSTAEAERIGVSSTLQVVPYYNKPSQEGLYWHFRMVAESTALPVMLYNIPGRTGCNMTPETIARLSEISNIVAVKEAAGSVEQVAAIRGLVPDEFQIYSGDDGLTLDFIENGAKGVVSVASHCVGSEIHEMIRLALSGCMDDARKIEQRLGPVFEALFVTTNPAPVKSALREDGFKVGLPRLPLVDVTEAEAILVRQALVTVRG